MNLFCECLFSSIFECFRDKPIQENKFLNLEARRLYKKSEKNQIFFWLSKTKNIIESIIF